MNDIHGKWLKMGHFTSLSTRSPHFTSKQGTWESLNRTWCAALPRILAGAWRILIEGLRDKCRSSTFTWICQKLHPHPWKGMVCRSSPASGEQWPCFLMPEKTSQTTRKSRGASSFDTNFPTLFSHCLCQKMSLRGDGVQPIRIAYSEDHEAFFL